MVVSERGKIRKEEINVLWDVFYIIAIFYKTILFKNKNLFPDIYINHFIY